ncbi:Transcriptional regulator, ArsR family protein [Pseudooceanicola batsensis HTCC2597]|uniref:Transcriptional regulator, ArsR family protein n=1 Tax=Pseudooceanicola batsensis (strain ATCC BAA-863 / DSM 15984 / KCTC 12145 / HTCC2597) TaxID=252305 RepID=A3TSB5_PSEBH|nr:metalloregulator ArsR/SmtB family transcription factor [Pseudooceanicola batsensis]EAQ04542.1 Transcriptional regulator, ArsR family protein [Pseudooceanicola batsensis HTCC2597]
MEQAQALGALSALAHETRLQIVRLLVPCGQSGLSAGEIGAHVACSASRLSFHLSSLEQAGLIAARREGRRVIYSARRRRIGGLIHYLLNDCCAGDRTVGEMCRLHAPDCNCGCG